MPLQRLELYAGKLARTVLRGLGVGNRAWLPIKEVLNPVMKWMTGMKPRRKS